MKAAQRFASLALAFTLPLAADQPIKFSNAAADVGVDKLVTFDSSFGFGLAGKGVVNFPQGGRFGTADRSYVAALFVSNAGVLTQIGVPANFRVNITGSPGTWLGGTRTLVGVPQGTPLILVVRAWDSAFPTAESAEAAGKAWGTSAPFTFQDAMSSPAEPRDIVMANFQGFQIRLPIGPEPSPLALGALGCVTVLWFSRRRR